MKKSILFLAVSGVVFAAALFTGACGENWLENGDEPEIWFTKIDIEDDGSGVIEGVARGPVHAVFWGVDSYAKKDMKKVSKDDMEKDSGITRWRFDVVPNLDRKPHTIYVCAASGTEYGALKSWFFFMTDSGYQKEDFDIPSDATASSSDDGGASSSGSASSDVGDAAGNYDFEGNITNLRNAITTTSSSGQALTNIMVTGIVHAVKAAGLFYIQDQAAGIYVYTKQTDRPSIGDKIRLTATRGQVYNNLKEVTDYTGYTLVSGGNPIYRQTGTPTISKQGQAWRANSIAVSSAWANSANITVNGTVYRNDTGAVISAGTYNITGPVGQFNAETQIMVWEDGFTGVGSSSSSSGGASSTSSTASLPPVNPSGTWALDGAKADSLRPFNNYYASAYGKTGAALKAALLDIIDGHTAGSYAGLYTIYRVSDVTSDGKVWDIYSDRDGTGLNRAYTYEFSKTCGSYSKEGDCYNREHMIPQSVFSEKSPMVCDAHHVLPTDGKVNGMRSNYPHATVGATTFVSLNGTKVGTSTTPGYTGKAGEPINVYKGDTARIYFYFSLRYNGNATVKAWDAMTAGARLKPWAQTLYREWNQADPVSEKERARNNGVQQFQKNRNPFIDYPELADLIDFTY